MVWEIPYTFIAGTKAKANEVMVTLLLLSNL